MYAERLAQFINQYIGKSGTGDTDVNKGQCVGLVEVWVDSLKRPHIAGNAKDLLGNADRGVYSVVLNGPNNAPPPGAIVCWDATWGGGFGHTAVVVAASPMWLAVFEQNNPENAPPTVATHGYSGVIGWIVLP